MDVKELRIGNFVNYIPREGLESLTEVIDISVDIQPNIRNLYFVNDRFLADIEPMPLTSEWLIKFGFETSTHGLLSSDDIEEELFYKGNMLVGITERGKPVVYYKQNFDIDIDLDCMFPYTIDYDYKHVHQLQNLYFALTGEELTIKK